MDMLNLIAIALVLLPQLWAIARRWSAAARVGLLTLGLGAAAGAMAVGLSYTIPVTLAQDAYHDSYYVVARFHFIASFGIVMGLLTALLFWAERAPAAAFPRLMRPLASILAFAAFGLITAPFLDPFVLALLGNDAEYERIFAVMRGLSLMATAIFALAWVALFALALFTLLRRWQAWSKHKKRDP